MAAEAENRGSRIETNCVKGSQKQQIRKGTQRIKKDSRQRKDEKNDLRRNLSGN